MHIHRWTYSHWILLFFWYSRSRLDFKIFFFVIQRHKMNFSDTLIWRTRTQTRAHPRIIRFIWSVVESENASTLNRGFATHYRVCALMCFVFECECGCVYVSVYEKFSSIFRLFEISIPCYGVHSQTMKVFTIHASVCECRQNFYTEGKEIHSQKIENVRKRNPIKRETEVLKTTQKSVWY